MDNTENKEVPVVTQEALVELITKLTKQLEDAQNLNEKLSITLERQSAKDELKTMEAGTKKTSGIQYGRSFNPACTQDKLATPYIKNDPGSQYRFISTHPSLYSVRRGQGYVPVTDEKGSEVRDIDTVLAKVPKDRYEAEVLTPRRELREMQRGAIATKFHDQGAELGIKTFGDITFDEVKA